MIEPGQDKRTGFKKFKSLIYQDQVSRILVRPDLDNYLTLK